MTAPVLSALSGILGAALSGAVLHAVRAGSRKYVVTRIDERGRLAGRSFSSLDEAKTRQFDLASKGFGSILLEKSGESGLCLRPVLGMTPSGRMVSGEEILAGRKDMVFDRPRYRSPGNLSIEGPSSKDFDTLEEQQKVTLVTTRFPTPEQAIREQYGPFPETKPFVLNPSSHEWKSSVKTWAVPDRFYHDRKPVSQPPAMVIP